MANAADQMRWVGRAVVGVMLVIGWGFILWANNFHITAPVVFVILGYLAVVMTVFNLWRTGVAAVEPAHEGEEAWSRPEGARVELEKEKRTLLKAIKEAEFDHAMGKLSKADADDLIKTYRARAIEVIKALDAIDAGQTGTIRERIDREVKARLELAEKAKADKKAAKKKGDGKAEPKKGDGKAEPKKEAAKPEPKPEAAKPEPKPEAAKAEEPKAEDMQREEKADESSKEAAT